MTAKEYFNQLVLSETRVEQLREEKQEALEKAKSTTVALNPIRVQTSSTFDKMSSAVVNAVHIDGLINAELEKYDRINDAIIQQIRALNEKHFIQVLYKVYIQHKSIRCAASEMKLSYSYGILLHKKALKSFEETYADILDKQN